MKYQIDISGMHCSGCKNLIQMSLEDAGFENPIVDLDGNDAQFISSKSKEEVDQILKTTFEEMSEYKYSNLRSILNS